MFSISPSELLTIGVIALIIFGPRRLPEMARKAGKILTQLRTAADDFKREVQDDLESTAEPFREAASDIADAGKSLKETADDFKQEVQHDLDEVQKDLEGTTESFREAATDLAAPGKSLRETGDGQLVWVDDKGGDRADENGSEAPPPVDEPPTPAKPEEE